MTRFPFLAQVENHHDRRNQFNRISSHPCHPLRYRRRLHTQGHANPSTGFPNRVDDGIQHFPGRVSAVGAPAGLPVNHDSTTNVQGKDGEAVKTDESAFSEPETQADDGVHSEHVQSGYAAVAALPADSAISVVAAGVVAYNLNAPVTVAPQIRIRDVLNGGPVDRDAVRTTPSYVEAEEWSQSWKEATSALHENRVLIVVAPRSYGSTTFSLRLLACAASEAATLIQLEADWRSPKIEALPLQRNCAYQLDLQDPDHDRFDRAFLNGLGRHAEELRELVRQHPIGF